MKLDIEINHIFMFLPTPRHHKWWLWPCENHDILLETSCTTLLYLVLTPVLEDVAASTCRANYHPSFARSLLLCEADLEGFTSSITLQLWMSSTINLIFFRTIDFNDTFLDAEHLLENFLGSEIKCEAAPEKQIKPFKIHFPGFYFQLVTH